MHDLDPHRDGLRGQQRYEIYRGLHELWVGYMWEVLGVKKGAITAAAAAAATRRTGVEMEDAGVGQFSSTMSGVVVSSDAQGSKKDEKDEKDGQARQIKVSAQTHGSLLAGIDFHGAEIEVVRCLGAGGGNKGAGCVGRVGTKGIVVRDTKYTFVVVGVGGKVRSMYSPYQSVISPPPLLLFFFIFLCFSFPFLPPLFTFFLPLRVCLVRGVHPAL